MSNQPLVSVIMNCHNGEKYLREAINSVYAQTYKNWEIVFWDNVSTDHSAKIAQAYDKKLKYFRGENLIKLYAARRLAVEKASGKYLAFLDVDDWWEKQKLEIQLQEIRSTNAQFIYSDYFLINEKKKTKKLIIANRLNNKKVEHLFKRYTVGLLSILITRSAYEAVGGFDENYHIIGDIDLVAKITARYAFRCIAKPLCNYRWHGENESSAKNLQLQIKESERMYILCKKSQLVSKKGLQYLKNDIEYNKVSLALSGKRRSASISHLMLIRDVQMFIKSFIKILLPNSLINIIKQ